MDLLSSSPLYAVVNAHFLLAGPILGLVGVGVLRLHEATRGWRSVVWLVGAKAVSTVGLVFPLAVLFSGLLPRLLGANPLGRLPWIAMAYGALLFLATSLLEWPFFHRAMVVRNGLEALRLSLRANAVGLVLLVALYLPFCSLSLLGAERGAVGVSPGDAGTEIFYLREGALVGRNLDGPEVGFASGLAFGGDARLFARRSEVGWDLWLQERGQAPRLVRTAIAPDTAQAPSQAALHVKLKQSVRTVEPALPETQGKPAECVPEGDSAWAVHLGQWPQDGLRVTSRDLRGGYRLALDTPLLSWEARCGTRLPGERLLFQMGPYLWLLDLETQRLRLFAKGQGAQVVSAVSRSTLP
jgi:hypothetical protein